MYNFKLQIYCRYYLAISTQNTQQTSDEHQPSHASLAHLSIQLATQSIQSTRIDACKEFPGTHSHETLNNNITHEYGN